MLERKGNQLTMLRFKEGDKKGEFIEIPLDGFQEASMEFSEDGKRFAMCKIDKTKTIIQVVECSNDIKSDSEKMGDLISKLYRKEYIYNEAFANKGAGSLLKDLSFIRKLKFDLMGKNLICFGYTKVFEVNLENKEGEADMGKLFSVNKSKYGRIYDLQYNSEAETKCLIACRVNDFR